LRTQGKNYSARVNFIADISDMSPGELAAVEAAFAKFRGARAEDRPAHCQRILDMVAKYGPVAVAAAKAWFETHHH